MSRPRNNWCGSKRNRATPLGQSSPGAFSEWQSTSRTFAALAAIRPVSGALADAYGTDRVRGALVTESLSSVFAIQPVAGRVFTAQEAQPGAPRTLLISHRLWTNRYAADLSVVGRAVTMNGAPATIVGVLPASADDLVPEADWWSPLALDAKDRANTGPRYLDVVGRLSTGTSIAAAREELAALSARLQLRDDDGSALGVAVTPFTQHLTAPFASGLRLLLAGVLGLMLIAAVNAAALLLTRAGDRSAEIALRASIGATRGRLARQLFLEAGMLASFACAGGVVVALWLGDLLRAILPADIPRLADTRIDLPATMFAIALGGAVSILTGLIPALRGTRSDLQSVLRAGAGGKRRRHPAPPGLRRRAGSDGRGARLRSGAAGSQRQCAGIGAARLRRQRCLHREHHPASRDLSRCVRPSRQQ